MKNLIFAVVAAAVLAVPGLAMAQHRGHPGYHHHYAPRPSAPMRKPLYAPQYPPSPYYRRPSVYPYTRPYVPGYAPYPVYPGFGYYSPGFYYYYHW